MTTLRFTANFEFDPEAYEGPPNEVGEQVLADYFAGCYDLTREDIVSVEIIKEPDPSGELFPSEEV